MAVRTKPAASRGMIAFLTGDGPVTKGPVLQLKMSAVVGFGNDSDPTTNSPFLLTEPLKIPGAACVLIFTLAP